MGSYRSGQDSKLSRRGAGKGRMLQEARAGSSGELPAAVGGGQLRKVAASYLHRATS